MKKCYIFLCLIFVLGLFLRFYRLGDIPVGFHRDEAFLGYNAYSIAKTGKDMSGNFLPLHLQSFLFSPAGYSYLSIPFILVFNLSAFSVRFASAFFGSLTILVCFLLSLELFYSKKNKYLIALASSFFLSISPWHINLSRTATENTVVVFFISLATLIFLIGSRKKNSLLLIFSLPVFAVTILIYQAPRAFLPFFIPMLFILFLANVRDFGKNIKIYSLFILFIIVPIIFIIKSQDLSLRLRNLSIFSDTRTSAILTEYISADGISSVNPLLTRIFHNKIEAYSGEILKNYFQHFSYDFLFTDAGFPDRYRIPSMGLMYIFELPLILLGSWKIILDKSKKEALLLFWIALAPIGSALTFDDIPNLQRTLIFFPAISIVAGLGFLYLISILDGRIKKIIIAGFFLVISYSFFFYIHQYFVHGARYNPWYRQDGYKELVSKVDALLPNYKQAISTNRESAPSVFFLFYSKYDPLTFQKETISSNKNISDSTNFSKYVFTDNECPAREENVNGAIKLIGSKNILYVNSANCKVPTNTQILAIIKRADGSNVFEILGFQ